jgi:hypothetical protein
MPLSQVTRSRVLMSPAHTFRGPHTSTTIQEGKETMRNFTGLATGLLVLLFAGCSSEGTPAHAIHQIIQAAEDADRLVWDANVDWLEWDGAGAELREHLLLANHVKVEEVRSEGNRGEGGISLSLFGADVVLPVRMSHQGKSWLVDHLDFDALRADLTSRCEEAAELMNAQFAREMSVYVSATATGAGEVTHTSPNFFPSYPVTLEYQLDDAVERADMELFTKDADGNFTVARGMGVLYAGENTTLGSARITEYETNAPGEGRPRIIRDSERAHIYGEPLEARPMMIILESGRRLRKPCP